METIDPNNVSSSFFEEPWRYPSIYIYEMITIRSAGGIPRAPCVPTTATTPFVSIPALST